MEREPPAEKQRTGGRYGLLIRGVDA